MKVMHKLVIAGLTVTVAACQAAPAPDAAEETASSEATDKSEAELAYEEANRKMHEGMAAIDPDPDIAFMQGMVPHHQGAVDMAEIVLKYGKDPEARALAETIIESQTKEIAQMNAWLEKRGVEPAKPSEVDHEAMGH